MNCDAVERDDIIERYLAGTLAPDVKLAWEEHYFSCEQCAGQLEAWSAIAQPLREMEPAIRAEMRAPKASGSGRKWLWAGAAIAAAILIAWAARTGYEDGRRAKREAAVQPAASENLTELARMDPPAYTAPSLRGGNTKAETEFFDAMKQYEARDYATAITGLQASLNDDAAAPGPRFFLGASELLAQRPAEGVSELSKVAAGDSPFAADARFYLAKGYLMLNKRTEALEALKPLAAGQAEFAAEARRLIARLSAAR